MARPTFDDLVAHVDGALERGVIYKIELDEIKNGAGWLLFDRNDRLDSSLFPAQKARESIYHDEKLPSELRSFLIYDMPSGLHGCISFEKKLAKMTAKVTKDPDYFKAETTLPVLNTLSTVYAPWVALAKKVELLKPMVVKGRRPSTEPRKTPERTLENTGTCPVCGKNVKLAHGKIVDHGFTVRWYDGSGRQGPCFGVGYLPFEVSPEGAVAYRNWIQEYIDRTKAALKDFLADPTRVFTKTRRNPITYRTETYTIQPGDAGYDRQRVIHEENLKSEIRFHTGTRNTFDKAIKEWAPKPLPGVKAA